MTIARGVAVANRRSPTVWTGISVSDLIRVANLKLAVRIRGSGPTIVLVHGNSCSSRCYEKQLSSPLAQRFRLVAIDLPGHGDSEPATVPRTTYRLPGYADVLAAAARELDAEEGIFVGWSLGGHIVLEATDRLRSAAGFLVFGAPPISTLAEFASVVTESPALGVALREASTEEAVRALLAMFVRPGGAVPEAFYEDFRRTDGRAREELRASLERGEMRDEVRIVAELSKPLAVIHGAQELLLTKRSWFDTISMPTLWRKRVQEIADAGHATHWEAPEAFNRALEDFASDCIVLS